MDAFEHELHTKLNFNLFLINIFKDNLLKKLFLDLTCLVVPAWDMTKIMSYALMTTNQASHAVDSI